MMIPWQILFLALANRCRGGLINVPSGELGRMFWAIPFAVTDFLVRYNQDLWVNLCYGASLFVGGFTGASLAAWGKYDTKPNNWDALKLTYQGLIFVLPVSVICAAFTLYFLAASVLLSGLAIAPCYALGWKIPSKIKGFEQGTPLGEVLFGGAIGLVIWVEFIFR